MQQPLGIKVIYIILGNMKYSKELKIGLFVVVVLVISFFVINYLRGVDIFNKEIEVVSEYENLQGLTESAPVFMHGYKVGKVKSIEYLPSHGKFRVTCTIQKEFAVPEDSKMTIYAVDIMGGKGVRIDAGESNNMISDGGFLNPAFEPGLIEELSGGVSPLISKVGNALDSLSSTVSNVNGILEGIEMERINSTISYLETTVRNIESVSKTIKGKAPEFDAFTQNLLDLSDRLVTLVENADSTVGGIQTTIQTINDSDLAGAIESLNSLLAKLNDPDGTLGKILNDPSLYNSLDSLLIDVNSLIEKISENPKKYLKISVF